LANVVGGYMTESFFKNESEEQPKNEIIDIDAEKLSNEGFGESFQLEEGRMAAILSYIPLLCFIPLLNMKDNKDARFHARQGVLLFLIELLAVIFLIDGISNFVFKAILIVGIILSIAGIYFSLQGKSYKIPIIGDLAEKSNLYKDE
jgi:uncharacterized membrane protein